MRVDIVGNAKAGRANFALVEKNIKKALYRCDLHFHYPKSIEKFQNIVAEALEKNTKALIVCGGDGTLNIALKPLMEAQKKGKILPPLCPIRMGTANDFATEIGISKKIDVAARAIMEGGVKVVDVIEIRSLGKSNYMLTNGGVGVAAQTAEQANSLREWVRMKAADPKISKNLRLVYKLGSKLVQMAGSKIYDMLLVGDVARWNHENWEVELTIPGKTSFLTKAPFIMVNNQPCLGGKFKSAPFTSNGDGTFGVLIIKPTKLLPQARALLGIRMGRFPGVGSCSSFETESIKIRTLERSKPLTFFGDGEILTRKVNELDIRCIHPGIPIATTRAL